MAAVPHGKGLSPLQWGMELISVQSLGFVLPLELCGVQAARPQRHWPNCGAVTGNRPTKVWRDLLRELLGLRGPGPQKQAPAQLELAGAGD